MDIYAAIKARYSCRHYADRDVDPALVEKILDVARLAPSAKNLQRTRVVVVRDADQRRRLVDAAKGQTFVGQAPVVLAFCAEGDNSHVMSCGHKSSPIDAAIFIDHVTLLAAAEGLATCWIGAFHQEPVREILGIPEDVEVIELLPLGYAADQPPATRNRLPYAEVVHEGQW